MEKGYGVDVKSAQYSLPAVTGKGEERKIEEVVIVRLRGRQRSCWKDLRTLQARPESEGVRLPLLGNDTRSFPVG